MSPRPDTEQTCWLSNNLADLNTTSTQVRQVAKDYLQKLAALGVDGYRFDAAIHVEPSFYADVLSVVPGKFAVGEIIKDRPSHFQAWLDVPEMDYKDFPLLTTMRDAFAFGGDLRALKNPKDADRALPGPREVSLVRNHDIDRGQADDRGLTDREKFGIGWRESSKSLDRHRCQPGVCLPVRPRRRLAVRLCRHEHVACRISRTIAWTTRSSSPAFAFTTSASPARAASRAGRRSGGSRRRTRSAGSAAPTASSSSTKRANRSTSSVWAPACSPANTRKCAPDGDWTSSRAGRSTAGGCLRAAR